jgi:hypothetical protein
MAGHRHVECPERAKRVEGLMAGPLHVECPERSERASYAYLTNQPASTFEGPSFLSAADDGIVVGWRGFTSFVVLTVLSMSVTQATSTRASERTTTDAAAATPP